MTQVDYGIRLNSPFDDYSITENGDLYSYKRNKITKMKPTLYKNGYRGAQLSVKGWKGKQKLVLIHWLVAEYFIGPRPEGQFVRHLDGDKLNNHVSNLAYGTPKENVEDTMRHGRVPKGDNHYNTKIFEKDIPEIIKRIESGEMLKLIGADYNVNQTVICHIKKKYKVKAPHNWRIISDEDRQIIKERLANGEKTRDLAIEYNVSQSLIQKIRRVY